MLRAVPAMVRAAASGELAFMSGIFSSTITAICNFGDGTYFCLFRLARALLDAERFQDEPRGGRILHDERERTIIIDRELDWDNRSLLVLRRFVELGHELVPMFTPAG